MDTVKSIEQQLVDINKGLPKLPAGLTKWIAEYAWLLVLIAVVLSIVSLVALAPLLLAAYGLTTLLGAQYGLAGYNYGQLGWLSVTISVVSLLIVLYFEAIAITPLKAKKYRGWQLIFFANLVSLGLGALGNIITFQLSALVWSLVLSAVSLYVLFQLRPYFVAHAPAHDTHAKKPTANKPAFKPAAKSAK